MTTEVDSEEVTTSDVERMSEEADVEAEIIESSLESKRINEKYNKYKNRNQSENEDKRSTSEIIKNGLVFAPKLFIDTRHAPVKGKITDLKNAKGTDEVVIKVSAQHNEIPGHNEKNGDYGNINVEENFKYDLKEDTDQIEYLLNKTESNNPSDMIGKNIHIISRSDKNSKPTQDLPEKPYNIADRVSNIVGVYKNYFLTRDEAQPFDDKSYNGEYGLTLIGVLLGILSLGGFSLGSLHIIFNTNASLIGKSMLALPAVAASLISLFLVFIYTFVTLIYLYKSVKELVFKEPGERYVIREVINR